MDEGRTGDQISRYRDSGREPKWSSSGSKEEHGKAYHEYCHTYLRHGSFNLALEQGDNGCLRKEKGIGMFCYIQDALDWHGLRPSWLVIPQPFKFLIIEFIDTKT